MAIPQHIIDELEGTPNAFGGFSRTVPASGFQIETGQILRVNFPDSSQNIVDGKFMCTPNAAEARISYIDTATPIKNIVAEFSFLDNDSNYTMPEQRANAVIGTTNANGFGLGSVQLAVYPNYWQLFVVQNPIIDPYPILIREYYSTELPRNESLLMSMKWDQVNSAVKIKVPYRDGTTIVSNSMINQYWGKTLGMQVRRPLSTSGIIAFNSIGLKN